MPHRPIAVAAAVLALVVVVAGCGDSRAQTMMAAPEDMARAPLFHPPLWRLAAGTTPVQSAPELWTVVWMGDEALGAQTVDFLDWMLHSDYWKTSLGEYGIGTGSAKGLIVMPTPAPAMIDDADLSALADTLVASGQVTRDVNSEIAFILPPTSTVTAGSDVGCQIFAGYHSYSSGSPGVAYSVNLRCRGESGEPIDALTRVLSHEVAEAATDPLPRSGFVDLSPGGQEIGDLCQFGQDLPVDVPPDATHPAARRYWVQRQYSDARAADGTIDPCLPLAWDRPYWNVAFDPPVLAAVAGVDSVKPLKARLDVFAYGDVGLIKWFASSAADVQPIEGEAHAGDTIELVVTPSSTLRPGDAIEVDILSESEKAGSQLWFGYVQAK